MPSVKELIAKFEESDAQWWERVRMIVTDKHRHTHVYQAFKEPVAVVRLPPGTVLWKFNDYGTLQSPADAAKNRPISPWWQPYHAYRHDPGWLAKERLAKHLGVSIREWGRVTSAVKENWNSLNWHLVITLRVSVRAAFGGYAQMTRRETKLRSTELEPSKVTAGEGRGLGTNLPGGGTQFYIPDLLAGNVTTRFESLAHR